MARAKRFSDVRRMLLRKLKDEPDDKLKELRDRLWDDLIVREFMRGYAADAIAVRQPMRGEARDVESAIRRVMRRG